MNHPLSKSYRCRYGVPVIHAVDTDIFSKSYFGACMECSFCHDVCCRHGADVTAVDREQIDSRASELAEALRLDPARWFTDERSDDDDWPGGWATRTRVADGACVFLDRLGRGCLLHKYALDREIDVHAVKPMVCLLWPITWFEGVLSPSNEIADNDLICVGPGATCYRSARADIEWYFGGELVQELDALETRVLQERDMAISGSKVSLPVVR